MIAKTQSARLVLHKSCGLFAPAPPIFRPPLLETRLPACALISNYEFHTLFPSQIPLQPAYYFPISIFIRSFQAKTFSKLRIYSDLQLFYAQIIKFQPIIRVNILNSRIFTHLSPPCSNRFLHRLQKSSFVQTFFALFAPDFCTDLNFQFLCRKNHAFSHPDSARIRLFKFYAEKIMSLTAQFLQKSHFPVFLQKKS